MKEDSESFLGTDSHTPPSTPSNGETLGQSGHQTHVGQHPNAQPSNRDYYVRSPSIGAVLGPYTIEEIRTKVSASAITADYEAIEAPGKQSYDVLKQRTDWKKVTNFLDPLTSKINGEVSKQPADQLSPGQSPPSGSQQASEPPWTPSIVGVIMIIAGFILLNKTIAENNEARQRAARQGYSYHNTNNTASNWPVLLIGNGVLFQFRGWRRKMGWPS